MRKKRELPEVEPVKLKSFHGIRPGYIILSGLIGAIILLFFLIFMLPGIVNGGKYVSFNSDLTNVGVYLDNEYLGSSAGSRYFIESGDHSVRYIKDGLTIGSENIEISHPIFFTILFHRTEDIEISYTPSNELNNRIDEEFLNNVSSWSKVISFNSVTNLPPIFSNYAKDLKALNRDLDRDLWSKAVAHISSAEMYNDYALACEILDIEVEIANSIFSEDQNPSYNNSHIVINPTKEGDFFRYPSTTFEMGSYLGESYPLSNEKRVNVSVDEFLISDRPVSEYEYALFVANNPKWSKGNIEELISDGLVDENYLNGITLSTNYQSTRPIRNISYYAASSYVEWLSEISGENYALPSEEEWSLAAYSTEKKRYANSIVWRDTDDSTPEMMAGGVWEFTSTEYVPLSRIINNSALSLPLDDIIIKGGSYINANDNITADTVGLASKSVCSEYLGFRVVCHE